MDYHLVLNKVKQYAKDVLDHSDLNTLPYHNVHHTESVVAHARLIAHHYPLNERERFIVIAAAWLHDLGYITGRADHEASGAAAAGLFLSKLFVPDSEIDAIRGCILATRIPQHPQNLLESIVCDADLYHLGTTGFSELDKLMRKETEQIKHKRIEKNEWRIQTIHFLEAHQYHTDFAIQRLGPQKAITLQVLRSKSGLASASNGPLVHSPIDPEALTEYENHTTEADIRPQQAIDTMFRISFSNHQSLNVMADQKAHILITVNSIILSAAIFLLVNKMDENSSLIVPTIILLVVSQIATIFAILATRPNVPSGLFSKEEVDQQKTNLLFFGNFYRMPLNDYREGLKMAAEQDDYLNEIMVMDGHAQSVVLGKKYRMLRISYNVFMFGLIISVIAFFVAYWFFEN